MNYKEYIQEVVILARELGYGKFAVMCFEPDIKDASTVGDFDDSVNSEGLFKETIMVNDFIIVNEKSILMAKDNIRKYYMNILKKDNNGEKNDM